VTRPAATVLSLAIALLVPAILVVNGLRVIADDWFVRFEYGRSGFPADPYGLTKAERTELALVGLRAILPEYGDGPRLLQEARLPTGERAFHARELRHMSDVRTLLGGAYRYQLIALGAIAAAALLLGLFRGTRTIVPRALGWGALLTLALAAVVAVLVLASYDTFFTPFHRLFFEGESWRFAEADSLRRLYPDAFWRDTAIALGLLAVAQALVLALGARLWARKAGARQAFSPRARTQSP
jgi:integral membrane protein (TIGR01906 family)